MRCTVSKTVFVFEKIAGTTDFGARWDLIVHHMRSQECSFASEGQSDGRDARCTLHATHYTLQASWTSLFPSEPLLRRFSHPLESADDRHVQRLGRSEHREPPAACSSESCPLKVSSVEVALQLKLQRGS